MSAAGEDHPPTEPSDGPRPPAVRPVFLVALCCVVLAGVVAGSFLVGRRSASTSLSAADERMLTDLHVQGEIGLGSSIANILRSDDEQVRLAVLVQRELATNLSMIGAVLLARSGNELPDVDDDEVFNRSGWGDLTQLERDEAFLVECVDWSEQVVATAAASSGIGGQLGPLVDELGAQAEELADLCRSV